MSPPLFRCSSYAPPTRSPISPLPTLAPPTLAPPTVAPPTIAPPAGESPETRRPTLPRRWDDTRRRRRHPWRPTVARRRPRGAPSCGVHHASVSPRHRWLSRPPVDALRQGRRVRGLLPLVELERLIDNEKVFHWNCYCKR